jgi:hypothetical protein
LIGIKEFDDLPFKEHEKISVCRGRRTVACLRQRFRLCQTPCRAR